MADVLRRTPDASSIDAAEVHDAMVGATLRRALDTHRTLREVDPQPDVARDASLAKLSPLQRAVASGHLPGRVGLDVLAQELSQPIGRIASILAAAEAIAGGREALAGWLNAHQAGIALSVSPEAVEQAIGVPPARRPLRWRAPAVLAAIALIGVAVGLRISQPANRDAPDTVIAEPTRSGSEPRLAAALPVDEDLTLRDCKIEPVGTELSFRGWLPLRDLVASTDPNLAAQPVYALVTQTSAEWVGWQTSQGRPMFPRPVGRLGCAVDPATAKTTVYAIPGSWEPPAMIDGCPASPIGLHGGLREIGGPRAFTLLPIGGRSWWSNDPTVEINVRISPSPASASDITAVARPLGPGQPVAFDVQGLSMPEDRPPSSSHYVTLSNAAIPSDGCWLLNIAVDGQVIGSAVLPVTSRG